MKVIQAICEYQKNPLGIDTLLPRFSWQLESDLRGDRQSAYRIIVALTVDELNRDSGGKWDTGRIESSRMVNIEYEGPELSSGERCYWKVMTWDESGNPGNWSSLATFEMGLLQETDWEGTWIAGDGAASSPLFRDDFNVNGEVDRARLYICGIGWHEAYLNGTKIGDHEFDPAPTWYDNIFPFEIKSRVLYVTHDVTAMLLQGSNALGVMLGHGWFSGDSTNPPGRVPSSQRPILMAQLNIYFKDGSRTSVSTNNAWQSHTGPITLNDLAQGESYDARLEESGWNSPGFQSSWEHAVSVDPPSGRLVAQNIEPERVTRRFKPVRRLRSGENSWIFDFGQFISGWAELSVSGPAGTLAGTRVDLRFAGKVNYETTTLDTRNADYGFVIDSETHLNLTLSAGHGDSYILKGDGAETWHPRFTIHGFRYVEVVGYPGEPGMDSVAACSVNNDIKAVGEFSCSNDLFNKIHHNVWWTFLGSFQGIPQDAADRAERCGWLGDPGFVAEDFMLNFRDIRFWSKWLDDIADTQRADGSVSYIAPPSWGESSYSLWPCWECSYTLFVWHCYNFYDDQRILNKHFDGVKKQVEYFKSHAKNLILDDPLGDHMEPGHSVFSNPSPLDTPKDVCGTGYFYYCTWILSEIAEITGRGNDAREYASLAKEIKSAFIDHFFDSDTHQIATGSQTSNALALHLDLVPEEHRGDLLENLVTEIMENRHGHLKTGIIGTDALEQALPKLGRSDVMYAIASKTTFPSWGYGVVNGQTTIGEEFGCGQHYSLSMKMQGSIEKFFYKDVAGISSSSPGYRTILVHPKLVGELSSARGVIDSIRGRVAVDWRMDDDKFVLMLSVPVGVDAEVRLPMLDFTDITIKEGATTIWEENGFVPGVQGLSEGKKQKDGTISVLAGPGSYAFTVSG